MNDSMGHDLRHGMASLLLATLAASAWAEERHVTTPQGDRIPLQAAPAALRAPNDRSEHELLIRKLRFPPASVDLTSDQTPVKNQGGRDLCGTFATIAALEAAYLRNYGLTLDLSEQYLNHWGQIVVAAGSGTSLPQTEVPAGAIGGGGLARPLAALGKGFGVPPESVLAYIGDAGYQNADQGDQPMVTDWWAVHAQRVMDDFNLADAPASYVFIPPTRVTTTVMPQAALEQARYSPTGITYLTGSEVNDVNVYRAILARQHEVIIEMRCCDGNPGFNTTTPWSLPPLSNGGQLGHVLLVVGYDDATQMVRVKNSWGANWADGGYAWLSYDHVRRAVTGAAFFRDVEPPTRTFDASNNRQLWLGRWNLDFDGSKGLLDLYNIPDAVTLSPVPSANYRVGTLFMNDGRIHRVNGVMNANRLDFWVDWQNPNPPASQLSGAHFTTYLFSRDFRSMAGYVQEGSGPRLAVEAVKGSAPVSGVARQPRLAVTSYLGVWDVNADGVRGRLEVRSADPATRRIAGRYVDRSGATINMSGQVNADNREFSMVIASPVPQLFHGFLNGQELGVMAGTTNWNGTTLGFLGTRRP